MRDVSEALLLKASKKKVPSCYALSARKFIKINILKIAIQCISDYIDFCLEFYMNLHDNKRQITYNMILLISIPLGQVLKVSMLV